MSVSVRLALIKNNSNDNFGIVQVRIIENSKPRRVSLKIKLKVSEWEKYFDPEKQRFKELKGFPEAGNYNKKIQSFFKELEAVGNDIELLPDDKKSFITYWNHFIKTTENHGTSIKHQVVLNKLFKYLSTKRKADLLFIDITAFFVRDPKYPVLSVLTGNRPRCFRQFCNATMSWFPYVTVAENFRSFTKL